MNPARMNYLIPDNRISPEVFIAHTRKDPSPLKIDWRVIEEFEFVLTLEGEGKIQILDRVLPYHPCTLLLIPPYIRHRFFGSTPGNSHHAIHFVFYPGFEEQFKMNAVVKTGFDILKVIYSTGVEIPLYMDNFPQDQLFYFERIIRHKEEMGMESFHTASIQMKEALLGLLAAVIHLSQKSEMPGGKARLELSRRFIEKNYAEKITLAQLSRLENLSPNYYTSLFTRSFGLTPVQYIRRCRVRRAAVLLTDRRRSVKEIADICGFDDPYYFSRVFRQIQGLSPEQYRRRLL